MLNKAKYKTRCKCMRKEEEEEERSLHRDHTNVLVQEFKPFAIKRLSEQISLLIINVNELKSKCAIFDKLLNEVVSNLYMFCLRMLNRILRDVNGTGIVTIDGKMFLMNTIINEEFLHPLKLGAIVIGNDVFSLSSG